MATLRCGLSCPHCLAAGHEHGMADMPLSRALDLVDQCAAMGVSEFLLTGGEPLARADLHLVIDHLHRRKLPYTINTAACPHGLTLEAMRRWSPTLAAVSLDGPPEIHDTFRGRRGAFDEAMQALELFRSLGSTTAAGTTVTSFNYAHLSETFGIVARSAAHSWGLHLVVPEGRAATRQDLMLDRRQLRWLIRVAAARRNLFPVSMADEIGYLGDLEPLLRDQPLRCGAGRAQCAILPDGSVVPCTTLDRSTSAGNINQRPLADIWREGFVELRRRQPRRPCRACQYETACRGGCWLMTRQGHHCHRDVFHLPDALRTAAGIAICLGTMAISDGNTLHAQQPPDAPPATSPSTSPAASPATQTARQPTVRQNVDAENEAPAPIDKRILHWYAAGLTTAGRDPRLPAPTMPEYKSDDPAMIFFDAFAAGKLPSDTLKLCEQIAAGLKTEHPSLSFAGLSWRALSENLLDGPHPSRRTDQQRAAVRRTMALIQTSAESWRQTIYKEKLDPYLARGRLHQPYMFEMSKAIIPPPPFLALARDTAIERWGPPALNQTHPPAAPAGAGANQLPVEQWLKRHPYAEYMALQLFLPDESAAEFVDAHGRRPASGQTSWGIFDMLVTPPDGGDVQLTFSYYGTDHWPIIVPAGAQLTYADAIRLVDEQHRKALDQRAEAELGMNRTPRHARNTPYIYGRINLGEYQLLLPAMRRVLSNETPAASPPPAPAPTPTQQSLNHARWWLADFWLF